MVPVKKEKEEGGGNRTTTRRMDDGDGKKRRPCSRLLLHPSLTSSLLMVILLLFEPTTSTNTPDLSEITAATTIKEPETTATTTESSNTLLIIGAVVGGLLFLLLLLACFGGALLWYRKRKKSKRAKDKHEQKAADKKATAADKGKKGGAKIKEEARDEYVNLTYQQITDAVAAEEIKGIILREGIVIGQDGPLMRHDCGLECRNNNDDLKQDINPQPFWHSTDDTGFLGATHFGYNKTKDRKCVLKRYDSKVISGVINRYDFTRKSVQALAKLYPTLSHANLSRIDDVDLPRDGSPYLFVVTEWEEKPFMPLSSNVLVGVQLKKFPNWPQKYAIAAQVMQAVTYLQSRGLNCYNLKSNNIMTTEFKSGINSLKESHSKLCDIPGESICFVPLVKLIDFAFPDVIAEYVKRDKEKALERSNLEYWPPEVRTQYDFNENTASYMCAMVMIEIWGNQLKPFASIPPAERSSLYGAGKRANDIPPLPDCIPDGSYLALLITRMMETEPRKRPWPYEAGHALRNMFFANAAKLFGENAGFGWPGDHWAEMYTNWESNRPGPIPPREPLPRLPDMKPPPASQQGSDVQEQEQATQQEEEEETKQELPLDLDITRSNSSSSD